MRGLRVTGLRVTRLAEFCQEYSQLILQINFAYVLKVAVTSSVWTMKRLPCHSWPDIQDFLKRALPVRHSGGVLVNRRGPVKEVASRAYDKVHRQKQAAYLGCHNPLCCTVRILPIVSPTRIPSTAMNLCQNCRTVTQHPLGGKGPGAGFEHDSNSLREAVENGCFVCSQFWESLTANQKDVATRPEFQGITCSISSNLYLGADGSKRPILATMSFFGKDDLWECDDAERVGWQRSGLTGDFSILDPTSMCFITSADSQVVFCC